MNVFRAKPLEAEYLVVALKELHEKPQVSLEAARSFLNDASCLSYLALEGQEVVGSLYGYALRRPESARPKFFLYEIDVAENHQRQGIGRALIKAFLEDAKRQKALGAWVQAKSLDQRAQEFYKACGGKVEEDTDVLFNLPY